MNVEQRINKFLAPAPQDKVKRAQQFGWLIYYACVLAFTGHLFNWTFSTFAGNPIFIAFGIIGAIGLTGNALVLPLVVKEWTVTPGHRAWAIFAYALDFFLMAGFVWVDTNLLRGNTTQIVNDYAYWIAPITGLIPILSWAGLFILDPEAREKYKLLLMQRKAHEIRFKADMARQVAEAEIYADQVLTPYEAQPEQPENDIYSGIAEQFRIGTTLKEGMKIKTPARSGTPQPETVYSGYDPHVDGTPDGPPPEFFEDWPGEIDPVQKISGNGIHPKG